MITLNEYLYRPIITQELVDIFEEFINSTYNENVLYESLLVDFIFETTENVTDKNIEFITNVVIKLRPVVLNFNKWANSLNNDKNSNETIKQLVNEKNKELEEKYNEFINKWFKNSADVDAKKILGLDNEKEISTDDIKKIKDNGLANNKEGFNGNSEPHVGNKTIEEILNYKTTADTEIKKKFAEIKKSELEENKKKGDKQLKDEKFKEIAKKLNDGYKEIEDKISGFKDDCPSADKSIETFNMQLSLLKLKYTEKCIINAKDVNDATKKLEEFNKNKDALLKDIQDAWDDLDSWVQKQKELERNATDNAAEVPEEVQQTAETESDIIKNDLVKKVASEVNIDVESLGKLYVQITKQLSESNDLTKKMVASIANTNDNDAIIGLNLMLLGAVTTKNLPNRSKIISQYCSIIQKSIETNKYDKIFDKSTKKESK